MGLTRSGNKLSYLFPQLIIRLIIVLTINYIIHYWDKKNLYHFTEVVAYESILFDYKIKAGNLKTTNAIRILSLYDYPQEVVDEALLLSAQISKSKDVKTEITSRAERINNQF